MEIVFYYLLGLARDCGLGVGPEGPQRDVVGRFQTIGDTLARRTMRVR